MSETPPTELEEAVDSTGVPFSIAHEEIERLVHTGAGMEQIRKAIELRSLAPWEEDLLHIYARRISNGRPSVNGERYLASLDDEIGA
jgi:hypothetical protein